MLTARGYIAADDELARTNIKQLMPKPFGAAQLLERVQAMLAASGELPSRAAA
jgi:DNA-binding response OmpR family regulator